MTAPASSRCDAVNAPPRRAISLATRSRRDHGAYGCTSGFWTHSCGGTLSSRCVSRRSSPTSTCSGTAFGPCITHSPATFSVCVARSNSPCASPTYAECPHTGDAERKSDAAQALTPGTRYLRARAERWRERIASEDAAGRIERALRQHLDPAAENTVWGFATTRSATLIASYLVERNEISAFVAAVADVRGRHPALDVSCTGPWAPYSFVTARSPEAWS